MHKSCISRLHKLKNKLCQTGHYVEETFKTFYRVLRVGTIIYTQSKLQGTNEQYQVQSEVS
jgi:hypothetical protein